MANIASASIDEDLVMLANMIMQRDCVKLSLSFNGRTILNRNLEQVVQSTLIGLNINPKLKGYEYLMTAITRCASNKEDLDGVTKNLYPTIAKIHGASADKVEHAIRHAIEVSWKKGDGDMYKTIFGYDSATGGRPTNTEFISSVVKYLERA